MKVDVESSQSEGVVCYNVAAVHGVVQHHLTVHVGAVLWPLDITVC